jgi:hypothetical protein
MQCRQGYAQWAYSLLLVAASAYTAAGEAAAVDRALCDRLADRANRMTADQIAVITRVPAAARVASECATMLRDDVVTGHTCVTQTCAAVDGEGIVERSAETVDNRLSACARATIDLVRLNTAFDLLTVSYGKVCSPKGRQAAGPSQPAKK